MNSVKRTSSFSQETKKIRKIWNEEIKLGIHPSSGSETEDVDLSKELHPLSHYMNNREEMIEQMFSIIKGDKLKKMLSPILKDMPLDELKADCLIHLLGMSKKRIKAILEGREINSSSDSESHSDSSPSRRKSKNIVKPIVIKQEGCSDISDNSEEVILIDPDQELFDSLTNMKNTKSNFEKKAKSKKHHKRNKVTDKKEKSHKESKKRDSEQLEISEDTHESSSDTTKVDEEEEEQAPTEGKTLLEILELEMRARAIRALIHKSDIPEEKNDTNEPEKQSPTRFDAMETEGNKITPKKKFRRKKRKTDDVIVITPKVVTIDLTDENDICSTKKLKQSEKKNKLGKKTVNIEEDKNDANVVTEIINKPLLVDINESIDLCENELDISENNQQTNSGTPDVSSELPEKSTEPSKEKNLQKTSWAQRWLESKDVKKVVSTSKICGNIRKRIKNAKLAKQNKPVETEKLSPKIQGSVDEYQLLSKATKTSNLNETPVDVSNSEQSFIFSEGNTSNEVQKVSHDISSSVDQVQDVSSTKNETTTEGKCSKLNDDSKQVNLPDESNNKSADEGSNQDSLPEISNHENVPDELNQENIPHEFSREHFTGRVDSNISESKNFDSDNSSTEDFKSVSMKNSNLQDPGSLTFEKMGENYTSVKAAATDFENKKTELENQKCQTPDTNDSNSKLPLSDQLKNQFSREITVSQSYKLIDSNTKEELNELTNATDLQAIKCCDLNSTSSENKKTQSDTNEPETLEINITDEDRCIDGMSEEKI